MSVLFFKHLQRLLRSNKKQKWKTINLLFTCWGSLAVLCSSFCDHWRTTAPNHKRPYGFEKAEATLIIDGRVASAGAYESCMGEIDLVRLSSFLEGKLDVRLNRKYVYNFVGYRMLYVPCAFA